MQADTLYRARISVSDQAGHISTRDLAFDTFNTATSVIIEAEDYNYENGKVVAGTPPAGYAGLAGTPDVDYHDGTATAAAEYRVTDFVGLAAATDAPRSRFTDAGATDYQITAFRQGDWMNYTRTLSDQAYHVYLRVSGSAAQAVRLDRVTGDAGGASQASSALGVFSVPNTTYAYVPLTDVAGNAVAVGLSGATTLRLTALASVNPTLQLNYLLLAPAAVTRPPYVSEVLPLENAVDVTPDSAVQATIVNGSITVTPASVTLSFNGNSVTAAASVTATTDGWRVTYDPPGTLALNTTCAVGLAFTDSGGGTHAVEWSFMTRPFTSVITKVVETGGDDSENTPPQFTGETFSHPNLGWITVPTFREDAPAYRDRVHQWNGATTTLPLPR